MYTENQVVSIARREQNTKRKYLVVNPYQGKHVPVSPTVSLQMFQELALKLKERYAGERLLLIGFAETATAIGTAAAMELDSFYMQTTREEIEGADYLYFSETHSHAVEQKLVKEDIERILSSVERVVFMEDEITTGNTVLHIVDILEKNYPKRLKFSVASLLNGMNEEAQRRYERRGVEWEYLLKTNHEEYTQLAESYQNDGIYHQMNDAPLLEEVKQMCYRTEINPRRCIRAADFSKECEKLWEMVQSHVDLQQKQTVLVMGTEEFMYPALYVGAKLEELGMEVRSHATTRSPIEVCKDRNYPLHQRYELVSLYDENRRTYVYDLAAYDLVLIVTDAGEQYEKGLHTLTQALHACGNEKIEMIRWCYE